MPALMMVLLGALALFAPFEARGERPAQSQEQPASPPSPAKPFWVDVTAEAIGSTAGWTNHVEIADVNGDGRPDLLFANGGNAFDAGLAEMNGAFVHAGKSLTFSRQNEEVFGRVGDLTRVIRAADLNADGIVDLVVGNTFLTQSRLYLGSGNGAFREVTTTHLPASVNSIADLEVGDIDGDGDLDIVFADWGAGHVMSNQGGRTRVWLNDGEGRFTDGSRGRLPDTLIRSAWDLDLADVDNDYDLDILVACQRCGDIILLRNDGKGVFSHEPGAVAASTDAFDIEAMDLDGDGWFDLVATDAADADGGSAGRRERVFRNAGQGRFEDVTTAWWPAPQHVDVEDRAVAFLDYDSDGDADFVIGSLGGPDRLLANDGRGQLAMVPDVFEGEETRTLALALADLDGDRRLDVVRAQGENPAASDERVFAGRGLRPDTAPPAIGIVGSAPDGVVRARVHDRKSPTLPFEWQRVVVELATPQGIQSVPMQWYGGYLWRAPWPAGVSATTPYQVCATDAAGNSTCAAPDRKS